MASRPARGDGEDETYRPPPAEEEEETDLGPLLKDDRLVMQGNNVDLRKNITGGVKPLVPLKLVPPSRRPPGTKGPPASIWTERTPSLNTHQNFAEQEMRRLNRNIEARKKADEAARERIAQGGVTGNPVATGPLPPPTPTPTPAGRGRGRGRGRGQPQQPALQGVRFMPVNSPLWNVSRTQFEHSSRPIENQGAPSALINPHTKTPAVSNTPVAASTTVPGKRPRRPRQHEAFSDSSSPELKSRPKRKQGASPAPVNPPTKTPTVSSTPAGASTTVPGKSPKRPRQHEAFAESSSPELRSRPKRKKGASPAPVNPHTKTPTASGTPAVAGTTVPGKRPKRPRQHGGFIESSSSEPSSPPREAPAPTPKTKSTVPSSTAKATRPGSAATQTKATTTTKPKRPAIQTTTATKTATTTRTRLSLSPPPPRKRPRHSPRTSLPTAPTPAPSVPVAPPVLLPSDITIIKIPATYKGVLPSPLPPSFNASETYIPPSPVPGSTPEDAALAQRSIQGVDFTRWNSSWLMRMVQLKELDMPIRGREVAERGDAVVREVLIVILEECREGEKVAAGKEGEVVMPAVSERWNRESLFVSGVDTTVWLGMDAERDGEEEMKKVLVDAFAKYGIVIGAAEMSLWWARSGKRPSRRYPVGKAREEGVFVWRIEGRA